MPDTMRPPDLGPLSERERALLDWLLAHGKSAAAAYKTQLSTVHVVARCTCGCPTIDLAVGDRQARTVGPSTILAEAEGKSPEGVPVVLTLRAREHEISELEVISMDDAVAFAIMNQRATFEDYCVGLQVVEEEFGLEWLKRRSMDSKAPDSPGWHPIPTDWKLVIDAFEKAEKTGALEASRVLIRITDLGHQLRLARILPQYDVAIRPRLRIEKDFSKLEYEIYVASLCVRAGYATEFVSQSIVPGERTPDLKMLFNEREIFAECVRKESYKLRDPLDKSVWERLWKQMSSEMQQLGASHHVNVVGLGDFQERWIPVIIHETKQFISAGKEGIWIDKKVGCALSVRRLNLPPTPLEEGLPVPADRGPDPVFVFGTVATDKGGRKILTNKNRIDLNFIDSHRLRGVLNTFAGKRQRKQIDTPGILYIDLDVSHVHQDDGVNTYLGLIAEALNRCFTPTANTRIGAVVLSTGPIFQETME